METRKQLEEMGFPLSRIEAAVRNAGDSIERCIEWLESHEVEPIDTNEEGRVDVEEEAAIECAPLTEEEKKAKLDALKERAAVRKAEQAKKDSEEQKKNAVLRKKHDQEAVKAMEDLKKKEAMKEAQKRREQAREDAKAKARIKELIEADKRARKAQAEGNKEAKPSPPPQISQQSVRSHPKQPPGQTRLRFRVQGQNVVKTYDSQVTVGQVVDEIAAEHGLLADRLVLKTTFPTRKIGRDEFGKTLVEADLLNASVNVEE